MIPKLNSNIDRLGFLKCMEWSGAAVAWSFTSGVTSSQLLGSERQDQAADFTFVQISDSHISFNKPANADVNGTLQMAVDQINAASAAGPDSPHRRPHPPCQGRRIRHLGQILRAFVNRKCSMSPANTTSPATGNCISSVSASPPPARPGKALTGACISSVSTTAPNWKGLARSARNNWNVGKDVGGLTASTPIVVFAHIPLWSFTPNGAGVPKDARKLSRSSSLRLCHRAKQAFTR